MLRLEIYRLLQKLKTIVYENFNIISDRDDRKRKQQYRQSYVSELGSLCSDE